MTLAELRAMLIQTGYPVFYHHWKKSTQYPECPPPPFICYLSIESDHLIADNKVYQKVPGISVELYTDKKDLSAEAAIEQLLDDNNIPYQDDETWIEDEQLYEKIYDLGMI
jgi:hypothetical protein